MREAELAELKKEVDEMTSQASRFDPFSETRREMDKTQREIETALAGTPAANTEASPAPTAVEAPASEPATLASPGQSQVEAQVGDAAPTAPESTTPAPAAEPKAGAESAGSGGEHR
jgi:hypothetical protein